MGKVPLVKLLVQKTTTNEFKFSNKKTKKTFLFEM